MRILEGEVDHSINFPATFVTEYEVFTISFHFICRHHFCCIDAANFSLGGDSKPLGAYQGREYDLQALYILGRCVVCLGMYTCQENIPTRLSQNAKEYYCG